MAFVGLLLLYSLTHTSALSLSISLERERCIKAEGGGDRLNKLAYTMRILYGFGARSDRSVADTGDDRPDVPPSHTPSRSRPVQNRAAYQRRLLPIASRQEKPPRQSRRTPTWSAPASQSRRTRRAARSPGRWIGWWRSESESSRRGCSLGSRDGHDRQVVFMMML